MIENIVKSKPRAMDSVALSQAVGLVYFAITQPRLKCREAFSRVTNVTQQEHLAGLRERYSKPKEVVAQLWHLARLPEMADRGIGELFELVILMDSVTD